MVAGYTTPQGGVAIWYSRSNRVASGHADVTDSSGLKKQPTVVYALDLVGVKLAAVENLVHNAKIIDSL